MIWTAGQIVPDDALSVSVLDRTFEHGLGLFETFRTWNGHATTLPLQRARLARSARLLGLPEPLPHEEPGPDDLRSLSRAGGFTGDAMFRITMSAGSDAARPVVWMRAYPLPPPNPTEGARIRASWIQATDDPLQAHKTLNYWRRRLVIEEANRAGFDEDLGVGPRGEVYEGTRTNLFVIRHDRLFTASSEDHRLLPGIMRAIVLDRAHTLRLAGFSVESPPFTIDELHRADEVFLTNAVRGIIPVRQFGPGNLPGQGKPLSGDATGRDRVTKYPAPGPWTARVWADVRAWLETGGISP